MSTKKAAAKKAAKKAARPPEPDYEVPPNDNISISFDALDLVPPRLRGTDRFLDVVSWNIRFFNHRDPVRVRQITEILKVLNADVIVLQEIDNGALAPVIEELNRAGAGYYEVAYGTTGGNQRIALLWDYEWVRSKEDISELFGRGTVRTPAGKDAFPRLPLWAYFSALSYTEGHDPFSFQLVGLHLKSQMGGGDQQRRMAAEWLAHWVKHEAPFTDSDVIMLGDWNKEPDQPEWDIFRKMEEDGEVLFEKINDTSEFSHLYYKNRSNLGSRLDLALITMASAKQLESGASVVKWASLDSFLEANPSAAGIKQVFKEVRELVSDHFPVVTRFYFEEKR